MNKPIAKWSKCGKWLWLLRLAGLLYLLQSVTSASSWKTSHVFFFFLVMWLISTQYWPWPASLPPATATEQSQTLTLSLGGSAPTAKSNTYSFGHRWYLWLRWTTTKNYFCQQTKQPSVNAKVRLQFYCYIRMLWHHNILYYQHQLPHHLILIIHLRAHCDNNMHF